MNLDYAPLLRVMRKLHSIPRGEVDQRQSAANSCGPPSASPSLPRMLPRASPGSQLPGG
jgi:hypothetical protein